VSSASLSTHNVTAAFRDLERASEAVERLRAEGVPEDAISVLGRSVDEGLDDGAAPDEPVGRGVGRHVAAGSATGTAVGGTLGALGAVAVATIPGVGLVAGTGALIGAIAGGGLGGTVGAIVEGESALRSSAGWQNTFQAIEDGAVVVGVHSDDAEVVAEAETLLDGLTPMHLQRVDDRGHEVTA
jgi:hypothetical protein